VVGAYRKSRTIFQATDGPTMSKQLVFMALVTLAGTLGPLVIVPFWGVFVYYGFAVLRPQALWEWSLPAGVAWSWYPAVATIAVAGGVAVGLFSAGTNEPKPARFTVLHALLLALGSWVCLTYLFARNQHVAYGWTVEYFKIFIMMAASALLIRTPNQVWTLFLLAGGALAYIAYEINLQYLITRYLAIFKNGYCGLDNNAVGLMLAMGVPICYFAWEADRRWWRWGFLLAVPVLAHAVLMSYSRGAMLSLALGSVLMALRARTRSMVAVGAVLAIVALPIVAGEQIQNRFFTVAEADKDESAQLRYMSWQAGWNIAKDNPIFGVGVRNSNLYSFQYGADREGRTIHNQYIQMAADCGIVCLIIYLALLGYTFLRLHQLRVWGLSQDTADGAQAAGLASGIESALAMFCFGGIFLTLDTFELPYLLLLLVAQAAGLWLPAPTTDDAPLPTLLSARPVVGRARDANGSTAHTI
jgi:probable O-glycosylation ligase (exosortase A-associated)